MSSCCENSTRFPNIMVVDTDVGLISPLITVRLFLRVFWCNFYSNSACGRFDGHGEHGAEDHFLFWSNWMEIVWKGRIGDLETLWGERKLLSLCNLFTDGADDLDETEFSSDTKRFDQSITDSFVVFYSLSPLLTDHIRRRSGRW